MHPFQSSKTQTASNTNTVHLLQSSEIRTTSNTNTVHPFQSSETQTTSNTNTVHPFQCSEVKTTYSNVFWGCLFCYLCGLTNSWLLFVGTSLLLPRWNVEFTLEWNVLGINPIVSQFWKNEMTALYSKSMQHNSLKYRCQHLVQSDQACQPWHPD